MMEVSLLNGDLTDEVTKTYLNSKFIAIDTETTGLNPHRDKICLVQICNEDEIIYLVRDIGDSMPNLKKVLESQNSTKLFHYARFDMTMLKHHLGIKVANPYCTKIASKLVRTYTDKHSLKHLVHEFLNLELDKTCQMTDWGSPILTNEQIKYAANDVIYLKRIKDMLDQKLERANRKELAQKCFDFLEVLVELDLKGWETNIFSH